MQHFLHISSLKREEKLCLETVAQKPDLFGILPIGFGKSRVCVLVVTLLVSIMKDQVEELTRLGLRAFAIGLGDEKRGKTFDRVSIFIAFR